MTAYITVLTGAGIQTHITFSRVHYDAARHKLYIFMEYRCNKQSNRQTADKLIEMGITANDIITCDSAEPKSIGDYKSYGLLARGAEKAWLSGIFYEVVTIINGDNH